MAEEGDFKVPALSIRHLSTSSQVSDIQAGHCDWLHRDVDFDDQDELFYNHPQCASLKSNTLNLDGEFDQLSRRKASTSTPFLSRTMQTSVPDLPHQRANDSGFQDTDITSTTMSATIAESTIITTVSENRIPTLNFSTVSENIIPTLNFSTVSENRIPTDFSTVSENTIPTLDFSLGSTVSLPSEFTVTRSQDSDSAYGEGSSFCSSSTSHSQSDCQSVCSTDSHHTDTGFSLDLGSSSGSTDLSLSLGLVRKCKALDLSEDLRMVVLKFSPREPDRLIGRKMGLEHVDVVSELNSRNISALGSVLEYLEPEDLCRMCMVSRTWKETVVQDPRARHRKNTFLITIRPHSQKENVCLKRSADRLSRNLTDAKAPLSRLQIAGDKVAHIKHPTLPDTAHNRFIQAATILKNEESLRKCPRCQCPARVHQVQERAWCTSETCGFDFCIKCLSTFHSERDCSVTHHAKKTKTDVAVGSKRSKKNLRRL